MDVTWESRRGTDRRNNNDAVAIWLAETGLVACIVDAAEPVSPASASRGRELAAHWSRATVEGLRTLGVDAGDDVVLDMLARECRRLCPGFIGVVAAYLLAIVDRRGQWRAFNVGDCRLGQMVSSDSMVWMTAPHRALEALPGVHLQSQADRCLTRSLRAGRFRRPELNSGQLIDGASLVLATDGFWYEHMAQAVVIDRLEDDASRLIIRPPFGGNSSVSLEERSDTTNCYVITD